MLFKPIVIAILGQLSASPAWAGTMEPLNPQVPIASDISSVGVTLCTDNIVGYESVIRSRIKLKYPAAKIAINTESKDNSLFIIVYIGKDSDLIGGKCAIYEKKIEELKLNIRNGIPAMQSAILYLHGSPHNSLSCILTEHYDKSSLTFYVVAVESEEESCREELDQLLFEQI